MHRIIIAVLAVLAIGPAAASASQTDLKPTDGYVCSPKPVATGWAIEFDFSGKPVKFVKLAKHVRIANGLCIEYHSGKPTRFVRVI